MKTQLGVLAGEEAMTGTAEGRRLNELSGREQAARQLMGAGAGGVEISPKSSGAGTAPTSGVDQARKVTDGNAASTPDVSAQSTSTSASKGFFGGGSVPSGREQAQRQLLSSGEGPTTPGPMSPGLEMPGAWGRELPRLQSRQMG